MVKGNSKLCGLGKTKKHTVIKSIRRQKEPNYVEATFQVLQVVSSLVINTANFIIDVKVE